jgi:hypothetical protein
VTAVLILVDRYTRRTVTSGVKANLWDTDEDRALPDTMVPNLGGHLVLLNRPLDREYQFRIDPRGAGYSGPLDVTFTPSDGAQSEIVWLPYRPDTVFSPGTTLVRGVVVRDGSVDSPAEGINISADPQGVAPPPFVGVSNDRGAFAVAVRLSAPALVVEDPPPVTTTFVFREGATTLRTLNRDLTRGREHIFDGPIDLDGANEPDFVGG